jgi:23S rRNA (guanosine2251-2'-O)-methyltransferase
MLIFGYHPVREALRHRPQDVERVFVAVRRGGRRADEIERLCNRQRIPLDRVSSADLARRVEGVHNGFAAHLRGAAATAASGDPELVVLVEDIQDPQNLGALLRVCEGAGVGRVVIRDRGAASVTAAVARTSAGASEWLAIDRVPNTANAIAAYRDQGYWVYGASGDGDPCWDVDLTGKLLLCIGGEEKGLRANTRKICDRLIGVPMQGQVESLNVSTAAAALLFEALRQRRAKP